MSEQSVPKQIRETIETSEYPELTVREVTQRTGLTEQQVYSAAGSMARLELDQRVGVVRLAEDDGGEFVDDRERELVTDGGVTPEEMELERGDRVSVCLHGATSPNRAKGTVVDPDPVSVLANPLTIKLDREHQHCDNPYETSFSMINRVIGGDDGE